MAHVERDDAREEQRERQAKAGKFRPAEISEWAAWSERTYREPFTEGGRVVARDELPGNVVVSTVFLGLDHNHTGVGEPVLFETKIFGGPHNNFQERYCTYLQALAGHDQALAVAQEEAK